MKSRQLLTVWILVSLFTWTLRADAEASKVDFLKIESPVIFHGDFNFAFRDPAAVYHEGTFHLYFTLVESSPDGGYYSRVAYSHSTDLIHWTWPEPLTPKDRNLNHSSPGNIVRVGDEWAMCFQTYPTPNLESFGNNSSRIWIARSRDLHTWSKPELLRVKGDDVPIEDMGRMIDPYLIQKDGLWWCFYKQNGVSISTSPDLSHWTYLGHHSAGENVTVIRDNNEYVMFHSPGNGIGIKRSTDLATWSDDGLLTLGQADWPWAQGRLTAATVIDLHNEPAVGKFVMFFHGDSPEGRKRLRAHCAASLALAWSDDLEHWTWPTEAP